MRSHVFLSQPEIHKISNKLDKTALQQALKILDKNNESNDIVELAVEVVDIQPHLK